MDSKVDTKAALCGVPDSATDEDWLQMTPQYTGITEFIKTCQTPMTIAIQGNWGVGKTSAMMNIEKTIKAEGKNPCIWFKTWQFSALKDKSSIVPEFMLTLLDKLGEIVIEMRVMHTMGLLLKACEEAKLPKEIGAENNPMDGVKQYFSKFDESAYDVEQLDALLSSWKDGMKEESKSGNPEVLKEWQKGLEERLKKLSIAYGIPIKPMNTTEVKKKESLFQSALELVKRSKENIAQFSVAATTGALGMVAESVMPANLGKLTADMINKAGEKFSERLSGANVSQGDANHVSEGKHHSNTLFLVKICAEMNHIIQMILEYYGEEDNRICIFVDDLDRLRPEIALELLECMKNFVEYKQSVFVLAIDKAVIDQGLLSKYDKDFLIGERDQGTGRNRADKFFDKIIQVPFTLPERSYDIEAFMRKLLKEDSQIGKKQSEKKPTAVDYAELLEELGIYNPRSIKRCFNLQVLYDCMSNAMLENGDAKEKEFIEKNREWYRLCYFAITILQIENNEMYLKMLGLVLIHSENPTDAWNELRMIGEEPENQQIGIVLRRFEMALEAINKKEPKEKEQKAPKSESDMGRLIGKWLINMLTSSNYNNSFSEKQIYVQRLRELVAVLDSHNALELDLNKMRERFHKSDKELAEFFDKYVMAENGEHYIKIGWGPNRPRPYVIIGLNEKSKEEALAGTESFEVYDAEKVKETSNSKNYYLYSEEKAELTIYISPNEKKSKECLAVLKNLDYLPADYSL